MSPTRIADIPVLRLPEADHIAATEYQRHLDQIRALGPDDWAGGHGSTPMIELV